MSEEKELTKKYIITFRIILCIIILAVGMFSMKFLEKMKIPPSEIKNDEKPLRVMAQKMSPQDIPVMIKGYGEIQAKDEVKISPEVAGRIVYIHPRLEVGEVIQKSEVLFRIDDRNYVAAVKELKALVAQGENNIQRLKTQFIIDEKRLATAKRNMELSHAEFNRVKGLFERSKVGTQSQVDIAEKSFNAATDQFHLLSQTVDLYPYRIKEAIHSLAANKARMDVANANLDRCEVKTSFDARIKMIQIEKGQFINTGYHALTLANDNQLEIYVPIDSRDAQKWLQFNHEKNDTPSIAWFDHLMPVNCKIRWTESPDEHFWNGQVQRVVKFDEHTRTITIAVHIDAKDAVSNKNNQLPLVEGMFCIVEIPGKILKQVYILPRWAVTYENTVYASFDNRLKTIPVTVEKIEPDIAIISKGIQPNDIVIVTRLTDPMENALLDVVFE